jgi:NAD(P)-dependent dehydrogenase (short-subunit alcohol dehydrogenase family)
VSDLRTAVVTGANSGIGLETARGLARQGFRVVLVCRNAERAAGAKADIEATVPGAELHVVLCDLGELASVRTAAAELLDRLDRLDVLVNNAGITLRHPATTSEGHEAMWATNHLGPFLLTQRLLPLLQASAPARIVNVASDAHRWGRIRFDDLEATKGYGFMSFPRYGDTKLMNVLFTRELARRVEGTGVTVNCVHPGAVATNIGAPPKVIAAGTKVILRTPVQGARASLMVATDPDLATATGGYFTHRGRVDRKLSKRARDAELAQRLWTVTEEIVGRSAG